MLKSSWPVCGIFTLLLTWFWSRFGALERCPRNVFFFCSRSKITDFEDRNDVDTSKTEITVKPTSNSKALGIQNIKIQVPYFVVVFDEFLTSCFPS